MNGTHQQFHTEFLYTDRKSKAEYVFRKYAPILTGDVLDVGADEGHLRPWLTDCARYTGIGFGNGVDIVLDLEQGPLPYAEAGFDTVLCLDVLEHVDGLHRLFDELCRVSRRYVLISLPNPLSDFFHFLNRGAYRTGQPVKFYGLPADPPADRHKWFFSAQEARHFIQIRAERAGYRVMQIDHEPRAPALPADPGWLHPDAVNAGIGLGPLWAVLARDKPYSMAAESKVQGSF